jgi:hypothetical protein
MEIVRLIPGERAPRGADCIHVATLEDGRYGFSGSVVTVSPPPVRRDVVSIVSIDRYMTMKEAEAAGIAWALQNLSILLYVESDAP